MARPRKHIRKTLEEAVAELKRDPSHSVQARVDGLEIELRLVPSAATSPPPDDIFNGAGPSHDRCHGG